MRYSASIPACSYSPFHILQAISAGYLNIVVLLLQVIILLALIIIKAKFVFNGYF